MLLAASRIASKTYVLFISCSQERILAVEQLTGCIPRCSFSGQVCLLPPGSNLHTEVVSITHLVPALVIYHWTAASRDGDGEGDGKLEEEERHRKKSGEESSPCPLAFLWNTL